MTELKTHGFAVAVLELYQGKLIEINTGEIQTTLLFDDRQLDQKSLVRGILKDALGDALILECSVNGHRQTVLINCWSISSIMELEGYGSLKDIYVDEYQQHLKKRK